jgi:hypothetical protein
MPCGTTTIPTVIPAIKSPASHPKSTMFVSAKVCKGQNENALYLLIHPKIGNKLMKYSIPWETDQHNDNHDARSTRTYSTLWISEHVPDPIYTRRYGYGLFRVSDDVLSDIFQLLLGSHDQKSEKEETEESSV